MEAIRLYGNQADNVPHSQAVQTGSNQRYEGVQFFLNIVSIYFPAGSSRHYDHGTGKCNRRFKETK